MIRVISLVLAFASVVLGQPAAGRIGLTGTVLDPSGAPIPGIRVSLESGEVTAETLTGPAGEFQFTGLSAGNYELRVAAAGFEAATRRVRLRGPGTSEITVRLALAALRDEVTVSVGDRIVSTDPARNADLISVERSLLDNLPILDLDYLAALARFLDPGGSGASLIVDGMEMRNVGVTPSAIQEIRINSNPYTAEYPRWSRRRIEVITKSSTDEWHGTFNFLFRDFRMNARDALASERPQEQRRTFEGSLFGPVGKSKTMSFLLSGARQEEDLVSVVVAQGLQGRINENVPSPQVNTVASLRVSRQASDRHAVFWQYNFQDRWQNNLGVGGTTLPEAGTHSRFREDELIFNHRAVITSTLLSQFRILLGRYWAPTHSNIDAPRMVVTGAFTGGGAQADRLATELHTSITWLLTQSVGRHTLKYGFNVPDWSRRGLADRTDRIGTLSFASLSDFAADRPFAAVAQRGDPRAIFTEKNVGGFFQDEWQALSNLSIIAGIRSAIPQTSG